MNEKANTYIDPDRKSYNQVCPVATALDFVGDRWTILILRELLGGSARFQELREGLPGIASNLLTERLRRLEADGLVRQIHAHNTVLYSLTEQGASIRTALEEFGIWAAKMGRRAAPVLYQRSIRAIAMALQAVIVRARDSLPAERMVVEMEVDGEYIEVVLDQRPTVTVRLSIEPDARVRVSADGISAVLAGQGDDATFTHVSGSEAATKHLIAALT